MPPGWPRNPQRSPASEELQTESSAEIQSQCASLVLREEQLDASSAELAARESALIERETSAASTEQQIVERETEIQHRVAELDRRTAELIEQQSLAAAEAEKLEAARSDEQSAAIRCVKQEAELEELRAQVHQSQARIEELSLVGEQLETERDAAIADRSVTVETLRAQYDEQHAQQTTALAEAETAREQAVDQLQTTRDELDELASKTAEQESQYLETQRRVLSLSEELEGARGELATTAEQLGLRDTALAELRAELSEALVRLHDMQLEMQTKEQETSSATSEEIERLTKGRQMLLQRLAEAEARAVAKAEAAAADPRIADYERRYQLALADLREQKDTIAALERRLGQAGTSTSRTVESTSGMDWESQKRRLLASLETSTEDEDPTQAEDRVQLREAIEVTERVVAEKDLELARLRQLLEAGPIAADEDARDSAAISAALDQDLTIQQERLKLEKLQQEWQEMLRQAEIDLSVERAKIGRERARTRRAARAIAARAGPSAARWAERRPVAKQANARPLAGKAGPERICGRLARTSAWLVGCIVATRPRLVPSRQCPGRNRLTQGEAPRCADRPRGGRVLLAPTFEHRLLRDRLGIVRRGVIPIEWRAAQWINSCASNGSSDGGISRGARYSGRVSGATSAGISTTLKRTRGKRATARSPIVESRRASTVADRQGRGAAR